MSKEIFSCPSPHPLFSYLDSIKILKCNRCTEEIIISTKTSIREDVELLCSKCTICDYYDRFPVRAAIDGEVFKLELDLLQIAIHLIYQEK